MKLPGLNGPTRTVPVVWPLRMGNDRVLVTRPPTVSLFPALGWCPPLLKHWYTAELVAAVQVMSALVAVLPRPASLNEHRRLH